MNDGKPLVYGVDYFLGARYPQDFAAWQTEARAYVEAYDEGTLIEADD